MSQPTSLTVAVVGATGVVGRTMVQVLGERGFPVGELRLLASGRSAGRTVEVDGKSIEIREAAGDAFEGVDIALFSAGADISRDLAPQAAARGATVIDNSSRVAHGARDPARREPGQPGRPRGPRGHHRQPELLHDAARAGRSWRCATRSGWSGWWSTRTSPSPAPAPTRSPSWRARFAPTWPASPRWPRSIRIPSPSTRCPRSTPSWTTGTRRRSGRSSRESRKILHLPELRISCTAVRVPVFVSHSEAVHVETRDPITPERARRLFAAVAGRRRPGRPAPRTPTRSPPRRRAATRSSSAGCARTPPSPDGRGLALWVVSDNLRKGAATNAVELAEVLVDRGWVRARSRRRPRVETTA